MGEIYNLSKGKVEVYGLEPLKKEIILFRRKEMESIPYDERVLDRIPTKGWFTPKKDVIYECGSYVLRKRIPRPEDEFLINEFVNDYLRSYRVRDVKRTDNGEYATLLDPTRVIVEKELQLTEEILLELLLENENYNNKRLQNGDLSRIRGLFRISKEPITTLDLEELKKYFSTNLVPQDELKTKMETINGSTKVYRKLR